MFLMFERNIWFFRKILIFSDIDTTYVAIFMWKEKKDQNPCKYVMVIRVFFPLQFIIVYYITLLYSSVEWEKKTRSSI